MALFARVLELAGSLDEAIETLNGHTYVRPGTKFVSIAEELRIDNFYTGPHSLTLAPREMANYSRPQSGSREPNKPLYFLWGLFPLDLEMAVTPVDMTPLPAGSLVTVGSSFLGAPPAGVVSLEASWLFEGVVGAVFLQDEIDTLRQEYLDFGASSGPPFKGPFVPKRSDVVHSVGTLNTGNYRVQLDSSLAGHRDGVIAAYRGRQVVDVNGNAVTFNDHTVTIPEDATVTITSAYRNPRRNVAVGSQNPLGSRHVWGAALDLVPDFTTGVAADGSTVDLEEFEHIYPTLRDAALTQGFAFREDKHGKNIDKGESTLNPDHVHLQWT